MSEEPGRLTLASRVAILVLAGRLDDRPRYPAAGEYTISHAEAVALLQGRTAGERAGDEAAARYPRHSAYQRELVRAR